MIRQAIVIVVLGAAVAVAAFLKAGVVNDQWNWCLLAIGITAFLFFASEQSRTNVAPDRTTLLLLSIIAAFALVQIVPLPIHLVALLSPARAGMIQVAGKVAGPIPSRITLSAVPFASFQWVLSLAGYGALFLVMRSIAARDYFKWAPIWPLLVIVALESALGMFQADVSNAGPGISGTYVNRDHYSGLLEMILPLAVMYAVAILQRNPARHESPAGPALKACGVLAIAALILVAIIHSLSRMGFLAALASLFVSASIALSVRGWRVDVQVRAPLWRRVMPVVAVAAIVALGFVFLPTDPLIARFADLATTNDISADSRAQIWRESLGLVREFPFFGCGLGGYESCFMRIKTVAPMFTVDYAHNDYLQILIELGIVPFVAGLILAIRLLAATIRRALYARSTDERFLMIGCTGSLVAILLHSSVDFNLYVPANGAVFAWICGIAASSIAVRRRIPSAKQQRDPAVAAAR